MSSTPDQATSLPHVTRARPAARASLPWLAVATGAAAAAAWGLTADLLIAGVIAGFTALAILGEPVLFLALLAATSGIGIGWTEGGVLSVGGNPINLAGLRWGLVAVGCGLLLVRAGPRTLPHPFRWYAVFVLLAAAAVVWAPNRFEGIKNLVQYAAPLLVAVVAYRSVRSWRDIDLVVRALWIAIAIGVPAQIAYTLAAPLLGVVLPYGMGLYHRGFAMWLLPAFALALAAWRIRGGRYLWVAAALFALALTTLARATVGAMLLLGLIAMLARPARLRLGPVLLLVVAAASLLQYGPMRERLFADPRVGFGSELFTITGSGASAELTIAGLNLSGRGFIWLRTFMSAMERPVLGHGTGSGSDLVTREFGVNIAHPHNDYLRVFHDQGVVGLAVVLIFALAALRSMRRRWHAAPSDRSRELALAALLALTAYFALPLIDNSMVYVTFFTANIFALVALALRGIELDRDAGGGTSHAAA